MWIVASVPFWIIGGSLFGAGMYGLWFDKTDDHASDKFAGVAVCLLGAGIFFMIAAKVAS